jgi:hypothetical protein
VIWTWISFNHSLKFWRFMFLFPMIMNGSFNIDEISYVSALNLLPVLLSEMARNALNIHRQHRLGFGFCCHQLISRH